MIAFLVNAVAFTILAIVVAPAVFMLFALCVHSFVVIEIDLFSQTVVELREQCRERGLKVGGTKAEIVQRIKDYDAAASIGDASIGDVGYTFRKLFDAGWYTGIVVKIRPGAANDKDRRCFYEDGDEEDLSLAELKLLAKLDPKFVGSDSNDAASTAESETQKKRGRGRPKKQTVAAATVVRRPEGARRSARLHRG